MAANSHHSYQSQNFYFPHRFPVYQKAKPKLDTNSSTPYNHRPTYTESEEQNAFSERQADGNQQAYNAQAGNPNYNNAPIYDLRSDPIPNQQHLAPETVSSTLSPLTSPQNNQYQPDIQYQQGNNQYQTSQYQQQYQQNNNEYQQSNSQYQQSSNQYPQNSNQYQQSNQYRQYQTNSSQYPQAEYQQSHNQYDVANNQYEQTSSQYPQNSYQYQDNVTSTISSLSLDVNSTQPQYSAYTATPSPIPSPSTNYEPSRENLETSPSGGIRGNGQQYSTVPPFVSETTPTNSYTEQSVSVPTSSPSQHSHSTAESAYTFPSTPLPDVSNDIRNPSTNYRPYFTEQTVPSTAEPSTQTVPPQTTSQSTDLKPEVSTVDYHHETFAVTPSSPSPFTLSTTHSPPSGNDINFLETTTSPSTTNADLKTTFDGSQTTFLDDANQINHALGSPAKTIDVEIDNHQSPSPTPLTFNVGQGFAQEATPSSTSTSSHFSKFIIDIPDEVTSIKSTSFGQVGNEVQSPGEHAAPSYPFTARVNDFLLAIGHHDNAPAAPVTNSPENVTTVAVTQAPPAATKDDDDDSSLSDTSLGDASLEELSRPSVSVKVPLASSESNSPQSIVTLPFGARLRAPKRRIYRRRIVL